MSDFKSLLRKWNKKLKDSGFDDIEFTGRDGEVKGFLKRECSRLAAGYNQEQEAYYALARRYTHIGTFEGPTEKAVWTYHSEGLSYDKILKHFPLWTSRSPIQRIILRHKEIMLKMNDE